MLNKADEWLRWDLQQLQGAQETDEVQKKESGWLRRDTADVG